MSHVGIVMTSMEYGGAERIAFNVATGLSNIGHEVDLVLIDAKGPLLEKLPSSISVVDLGSTRVATSVWPLKRYLEKARPDALYAMMTEINVITTIAHQLSRVDTRLVLSEHNTPSISSEGLKDEFVLKLAAKVYPRADKIVAVSAGVKRDLLDVTGIDPDLVTVIHNPIDVEWIRDQATEHIEHPWFDDDSLRVVLSAGRHVPQKGFDTLIRAFARLDDPAARLMILGSGEQTESLESLVSSLGLSNRVEFTGFVDNPFAYMDQADVFVLSSWYEGFGNVLIEAMATGCPVVSTDCPSGPNEILESGEYGQLVPVRDPDSMASAIGITLEEQQDSHRYVERSNDFAIESVIPKYYSVLI
ncbi:glycosyltransferase [Natrialba sp. INN-245]|uniref:glycosyltransferase n=1 Tax=Natrialba sp. INN-245 TaxID=2690967 RepID=UPI0013110144|nr:glycosyltransferase [Natrialba sp. INN-245]MWV40414.1 glycosyltransferase [Natrialba sp. INN-245]